jgi:hypothetical protein
MFSDGQERFLAQVATQGTASPALELAVHFD